MIHVHKLKDYLSKSKHPAHHEMLRVMNRSVTFDVGSASGMQTTAGEATTARPPFPCTALQIKTQRGIFIIVFDGENPQEHFWVWCAGMMHGESHWTIQPPCEFLNDGCVTDYDEDIVDSGIRFANIARMCFAVMACSNIETRDVQPEQPAFAAKLRKERGLPPLHSYKILTIRPDELKTKSESQGGTHASPRVHLRRGHIRKLPDGRTVWVQSCTVGDKTRGIVEKDYRVEAEA